MKKWIFWVVASLFVFTNCKKKNDCTATSPATVASTAETSYINGYLTAKGITNASQKQGMYYVINNQGSGESPNLCSNITLTYKGEIFYNNGTIGGIFDETKNGNSATFVLSGLIQGWQLVFPLVKAGGTVDLYIPPSLGYGTSPINAQSGTSSNGSAYVGIPANSYLKFTVSLISVN